ncbi:hypothetical protein Hdeb2414_s0006g00205141 [Helianthus debilis subsp. tardiflorus]
MFIIRPWMFIIRPNSFCTSSSIDYITINTHILSRCCRETGFESHDYR